MENEEIDSIIGKILFILTMVVLFLIFFFTLPKSEMIFSKETIRILWIILVLLAGLNIVYNLIRYRKSLKKLYLEIIIIILVACMILGLGSFSIPSSSVSFSFPFSFPYLSHYSFIILGYTFLLLIGFFVIYGLPNYYSKMLPEKQEKWKLFSKSLALKPLTIKYLKIIFKYLIIIYNIVFWVFFVWLVIIIVKYYLITLNYEIDAL